MLCPVCSIEMVILELHEVEIDWCPQCRGVWLDEGELELLVQPSANDQGSPLVRALRDATAFAPGRRPCPVCRRAMARVPVPLVPPLDLDRCPRHHGLWFDDGELEQVCRSAGGETVAGFLGEILGGRRP